jgi:hypothetical protein
MESTMTKPKYPQTDYTPPLEQLLALPRLRQQSATKHHQNITAVRRVLPILEELATIELPREVKACLLRACQQLLMPFVLSKVPGDSVVERARNLGIARTTYYQWLNGRTLPNRTQAAKLAELTGVPGRLFQ